MELFDRYIAEDKKSISYLKQIADDAKEQYLKHLSNDTLSEILTKKELSVKDSFTAYLDRMQGDITNDLYEKLLLESPLFQFYIDKYAPLYTDEQCVKLRDRALKNLDYNLRFFSKLDQGVFRAEIARFLASRSDFIQVDNLKDYDKKAGVYIMVLGNYCQLYIGVSSNISQRIQAHWMYNTHPLDRLIIMGDIEHSKICVDAFGPLDTTEIYAKLIPNPTVEELSAIEQELITGVFSDCFLLNRTSGGLDISKISFRVDLC